MATTCGTATLANVDSDDESVTILAANGRRVGAIGHNDSSAILYLKYGTTASSTSYTYEVAAGAHWVMDDPVYQGLITGIWVSANGAFRVTELT